MRGRALITLALGAAAFLAFAAPTRRRAVMPPTSPPLLLDARRSFVITEKAVLDGFSFDRLLNALVARSGAPGLTSAQLYRQWFDTQNPKPGLADPTSPHCDDFMNGGQPLFNGFPRRCPTPEANLASHPYSVGEYIPIGLTNRFDLAPPDGSNCGEYRLIFAHNAAFKASGLPPPPPFLSDRLHIIFEAVLPNPNSALGLDGCRAVAQFWADLSKTDALSERRSKLESFYFDGLPGYTPVVHPDNFGLTGGRIRTMQFTPSFKPFWRFYQFRTAKECPAGADCTLRIVPDVLENLAFAPLLNATNSSTQAQAFREEFLKQIPNLAIRDVNLYFIDIPREFLIAESDALDTDSAFDLNFAYIRASTTPAGQAFRAQIQQELTKIGSSLLPEQVVFRAQTLNCDGCHESFGPVGEGLMFPHSIDGLQHISEDNPENSQDGIRYAISPALRDVFIPHRLQITVDFLTSGKVPTHSKTIGGGRTSD